MSPSVTPRYNFTISTKNVEVIHRRDAIKQEGKTDEDIYIAGLEVLEINMKKD
jgi:hypothetical protein